jgi:5'-nucleotidase
MRHFLGFALFSMMACASPPPPAPPSPPPPVPKPAARPDPAPARVRIVAFNDFHGNLKPPPGHVPGVSGEVGGAAWFAAHVKKLTAGKDSIIVAAGDLIGASPLTSGLFHDEPTIDFMNALGLSATTIGNHELDEGLDELLRMKRGGCHPKDGCKYQASFGGAKFDYLSANVTAANGTSPFPAYVVREVGGIPIAFVGMPLEGTPHNVLPKAVAGITFADEVKTANALVPEIRAKGVETMVLLIHQGGEAAPPSLDGCADFKGPIVDIVEKLDRAYDVVVSGHTHALYNCRVAGRPVTSASSFGRVVTTIDLTIDPKTRDVVSSEAHNHAITHDIAPDSEIGALVERATAVSGPLENRVIGRITESLTGSARSGAVGALGLVIADAQLEATKKVGARIAITNRTGIRSDLVFAKSGDEKEDGIVTYGEAFASQPFGNELVTITVKGKDLLALFERAGRSGSLLLVSEGVFVRYGADRKLVELKIGGKPVGPKDSIRLTTSSFIAEREENLRGATDKVDGPVDIDAFEAYFAKRSPVSPPKKPRIVMD